MNISNINIPINLKNSNKLPYPSIVSIPYNLDQSSSNTDISSSTKPLYNPQIIYYSKGTLNIFLIQTLREILNEEILP